jgi:hypothetical protein
MSSGSIPGHGGAGRLPGRDCAVGGGPDDRGEGGQAAPGPTTPAVTSDEDQPCAFGSLLVVVNDSVYVDGVLPEPFVYVAHVSCCAFTKLMHG